MAALPEILSRWTQRFRAKPPAPVFEGAILSTTMADKGSATLSEADVEAAVLADYEAVVGKVVFLQEVEGYDSAGDSLSVYCDPPAVARIVGTNRDSVLRWMDDVACDPIYQIEILEPHPSLAEIRPSWTYATSRSTDGTVLPGPYAVASGAHQRWYQGKGGVPEEAHAAAALERGTEPTPVTEAP